VITVTETAARKIAEYMAEEPAGTASVFRLAIQGGGCSGFQYEMCFEPAPEPDDTVLEAHGVRVVVDPASAPLLAGATVDWADTLMATGFAIENPNVEASCGCGTSFTARADALA
jgi:iron-sulfur cluster assembly accessory protein